MRFITTQQSNFDNRDPRWVFMKAREGGVVEGGEREDLFARLKSPRQFSVADIRKLDQYQRQEGELNAEQKARLNGFAEFHLSLIAEDFDQNMPSRALFELRYSNLWKHIRRPVAARVETMMSRQRQKLQPLYEKGIESFSGNDMERFMRYYQSFHLKARKTKLTKKDQEFADVISKKFIEHTHKLMTGFKIVGGKLQPANPNTDENYLGKLRTRDKLFIMQAYRMFSRQYDWAARSDGPLGTSDRLKEMSQAIVKDMVEKLTGEGNQAARIEFLPMWEVIEDLTENEHLSFGALNQDQKDALEDFARRSRSAHLLNWVKNWQKNGRALLLPAHLASLKEIQTEDSITMFGKDPKELGDVLDEFVAENGKLYISRKNEEGETEFIDALEAVEKEREKIKPKARWDAFKENRKKFLASAEFKAVKSGVASPAPVAEGVQPEAFGATEFARIEEVLMDIDWDEAAEIAAEKAKPKRLESPWEKALGQTMFNGRGDEPAGELFQIKESIGTTLEGDSFKDSKPLAAFYKHFQDFFGAPAGKAFYDKEQEVIKAVSGHQAKAAENDARIQEYVELARSFSASQVEAGQAIEKYNEALQGRIDSRRLTGADMAVLFDESDEVTQALDLGRDDLQVFTGKLQSFRTGFGNLIPDIINDVETEFNRIGGLNVSDEDRLRLWFEVLDKALGYENINAKINGNAGLNEVYQEILNDNLGEMAVSANTLIEGALSHYRERIYTGVIDRLDLRDRVVGVLDEDGNAAQTGEQILADYLSRYDRMHHNLYQTGEKQATVETGHRKFVSDRQENQIIQDTVRQNMYQAVGKVDRDKFSSEIRKFLGSEPSAEALVSELGADRAMYEELMQIALDSTDINNTRFFQRLSNVVPAEMQATVMPELAKMYILWQTREKHEDILDDVGGNLLNGAPGVPGRHDLAKLKLRAVEFEGDFDVIHSQFRHDFAFWNRRMNGGESVPHSEMAAFFSRISNELSPRINSLARNMQAALAAEFPGLQDTFIASYINSILRAVRHLEFEVKTISGVYEGASWDRDSSNDFQRIQEAFLGIKTAFSLENGSLKEFDRRLKTSFEQIPKTVKYLKDELGLFEPGGKKKAELKFKKLQRRYHETFTTYKEKNEKVIEYLKKDIKKMSAKDFKAKHEITKPTALRMIEEMEESAETFNRGWQRFSKPDYFENDFMVKYSDPERQTEALLDFQTWPVLEEQVGPINKVNDRNKKWIKNYEGNKFLGTKFLHKANWPRFGVKYTFSLLDLFYRMPKKIFEAFDRRQERRRERAVAELGYSIFGNSNMGKEFQRMRWEEEDKRVKEFETRYENENFDVWERELYKLKNPNQKDEARALINLLIKDGYMRWDKPELWRVLERLQRPKKISWNIPDDLNDKSLDELMVMIGDACTHIWTQKIFTDWDGQLEGNHKKQMESNYKNFDRMCNRAGSLDEYFSTALEGWRNGDTTINPAEFEGFLHRAFEFAKYNSVGGDKRWYYLILGMTIKNHRGETLISHEAKDRFNKTHLKAMPFFDFFVDNACWKKDGMPVPEGTPGAHDGGWTHDDIQAWGDFMLKETNGSLMDPDANYKASEKFMMYYIMNSPVARLRSDRFGRAAGDSQDHDDAWIHGAGASYQNILQMLNRSSQGSDTISPDFAAQMPQAYDIFMRHNTQYLKEMEAKIGGTPGWEEWKNHKLVEIGLVIRKMFLVTNTIAGNYHGHSAQSPQTVDQMYWRDDPNMTGIQENRKKINAGVKALVEISGGHISDEVLDYTGVLAVGDNYTERKADKGYQAVSAEVGKVLNNEEMFSNLDYIQKWIDKMYP